MLLYKTARLADWLKQRPSDLWSLSDDGYDAATRIDFDFAVMDWWDVFDSYRHETKPVIPPHVPKGKVLGPRYANDGEILRLKFGAGERPENALDPVLEGVSDEALWGAVEGWDA